MELYGHIIYLTEHETNQRHQGSLQNLLSPFLTGKTTWHDSCCNFHIFPFSFPFFFAWMSIIYSNFLLIKEIPKLQKRFYKCVLFKSKQFFVVLTVPRVTANLNCTFFILCPSWTIAYYQSFRFKLPWSLMI